MLDVRAFQPDNYRDLDPGGFCCFHDARGHDVAPHDSSKNINEDGLHIPVREQDAERVFHLLRRCAAADVEKVCGAAAGELDDVHRAHGKACAVHHAGDVAVELDVVETELAGFDFERIFLVEVAKFFDVLVTVERVVVEIHFRVERIDFIVAGDEEWIDFRKRGVGVFERPVERNHELHGIINQLRRQPEAESETARLEPLKTKPWFNVVPQDRLRIFGSDLFDIHAAGSRSHEDGLAGLTIDHKPEIKFLADIKAFFNQDLLDLAPFGSRLSRHQVHSNHPASDLLGFVHSPR